MTFDPAMDVRFDRRERKIEWIVDRLAGEQPPEGSGEPSAYSGFAFNRASFSLMNARISSAIDSSFAHCSL